MKTIVIISGTRQLYCSLHITPILLDIGEASKVLSHLAAFGLTVGCICSGFDLSQTLLRTWQ